MKRIYLTVVFGLAAATLAQTARAGDEPKKGGDEPKKAAAEGESDEKKATTGTTEAPPKAGDHWESTDVYEAPEKSYLFIGARYRGTIVPQFLVNIFVNEGRTFYSNAVGLELDYRKDGFSLIPSLTYAEYSFGDTLFLEKAKDANFAGNWSRVNSSLKGIYANADLLWSTKISNNFDFEYGLGVGLGFMFGDLGINWVYQNANGPYGTSDGKKFSPCLSEGDGTGCRKGDHSGASVAKVNNYVEPSWADGGSRPLLFPHISIPQLGLRFKPVKEFQARLGIGFALTGPWFGISADYGLEKKPKPKPVEP